MNLSNHTCSLLLSVAFAPSCAAATQGPTVESTLTRAREALGWGVLVERRAGVEVVGSTRVLGTDATERTSFDCTGRTLTSVDGAMAQQSGFDGVRRWERDWSNTARELVLGDASSAELEDLVLTGRWCVAAEQLRFELAPQTDADELTLMFRHADGVQHGAIVLDAATLRPRSARYGSDGAQTRWSFSDWRVHDGLAFPWRVESSEKGMQRTREATSVRIIETPGDAVFAAPLDAPSDTRFDASIAPQLEVKRVRSGHLLVHPTIDGRDLGWFIFDSGAGTSCISKTATAELEGPLGEILANGIGGHVPTHFWRAKQMRIGPVTVERPSFMELDLAFLEPHFGVPVGGILGYELFMRCVAEVDMTNGAIALHDPASYSLPTAGRWEQALIYGRQPCVRARAEDHEGVYLIDTGAANDTVTLHYQLVLDGKWLEGRDTTDGKAGGVGGFVATRVGKLASFRLGGHDFENVPASFALEDKGALANDYIAGNIGGKLLEPFQLVFDYPHRRIGFVERMQGR